MKTTWLYQIIFLFLSITCSTVLRATPPDGLIFRFAIVNEKPEGYAIGDSVQVILTAIQQGKACETGLEKSRLFGRGVKIINQKVWKETISGGLEKPFTIIITGNSKNLWQVTAFRKTDKGEIAETLTLKSSIK